MELWKEINFMKAKSKYEESIKKNEKICQKQLSEIKTIQSIKAFRNFANAVNEIR